MNLREAQDECNRWLAYLEDQKARSLALQKLAADVRKGLDKAEVHRRRATIDNSITVYDGTKLSEAVKFLLEYVDK